MRASTWLSWAAVFSFISAAATSFSQRPAMAALPLALGALFVALAYQRRKEGR